MMWPTTAGAQHRQALLCAAAAGAALLGGAAMLCYYSYYQYLQATRSSDDVADEKRRSGGCVLERRLADNTDAPFTHLVVRRAGEPREQGGQPCHPYHEVIRALQAEPAQDWQPQPQPRQRCEWVSTPRELQALRRALAGERRIALDCEHNALRSYLGLTCLVQISAGSRDYLIDAIALHDNMHELAPILADPAICKVLHGCENDVLWLQRDFHLYLVNVHDTQKLAAAAGFQRLSLRHLLQELCGVAIDKSYQSADWMLRPLPAPLVEYARQDVHHLLRLHDQLLQRIAALGAGADAALAEANRRSQAVCLSLYAKTPHSVCVRSASCAILRRYLHDKPGKARGGDIVRDCVHALCEWRDRAARRVDEGAQYVLPDDAVLALATGDRLADSAALVAAVGAALPPGPAEPAFGHCSKASEVSWVVQRHQAELFRLLRAAQKGQLPWGELDMVQLATGTSRGGGKTGKNKSQAQVHERLVQKFSAKAPVYENCRMLSQEGELLCHCDRRKMRWYLERGLATAVPDQENTIRLTFQHQNSGKADKSNRFYATSKSNQCVVCGEAGHYLRYRVVPSCYRRHFPLHLKSHRSHDIVLVCISCHEAAQVVADEVKRELAAEHGIPLNPPASALAHGDRAGDGGEAPGPGGDGASRVLPHNARRAAQALCKSGPSMPPARREELEAVIKAYLGRSASKEPEGLRPGDLEAAIVAGVTKRRRTKLLRRYGLAEAADAEDRDGPAGSGEEDGEEEEEEATGAEGGEGGGRYPTTRAREDEGDQWGHGWHGSRVVAVILEAGGDEQLLALIRRFRARFVERLAPRFMPPGWEVEHAATRAFGMHSVYRDQPR
eukprot:jgi/Tetstr1/430666/TSEL_020459.t1